MLGSPAPSASLLTPPVQKSPVYYSCLSSHHVDCLLPVSWMDWQQFRVATWNPALPSTLKQIPLSLTRPTTLMCARRKARAHTESDCHCSHPHTKTFTYKHTHTHQFWEMPVRSPFELMCFLNTMGSGFSDTAIIQHSRGKRNESNTAVIANLLRWWIISSQWLPCLLKTYWGSNIPIWVLISHM